MLEVSRLSVRVSGRTILREVSLEVAEGEALGLVGESGSGKSMTAKAIARLLPPAATAGGSVRFEGRDVLGMGGAELRGYRTREVAMIFQDPRAAINPVRSIGDFLTESLRINLGTERGAAEALAVRSLREVGIADGARRMRQYPHELSGGLLQRVMIASALAVGPRLILADEPTTALDVTTQEEVMAILDELRREHGMAMVFITHDLDLAAAVCDRTAVMYSGSIVECRVSAELEEDPRHPYTAALIGARPDVDRRLDRLVAVPGRPVSAWEAPPGCAFSPRCGHAVARCAEETPPATAAGTGAGKGTVACHRAGDLGEVLRAAR
ncbi:ABC transporter ATP-binding protein [Streptosporangium sp. NPDC051022]|uniref:ABC transporter ATP-binding protein n=1 Tax=Streptosporangium sp. NPDC051022 TaxID=3155752 RepID=UPI00342579D9